MVKIIVDTVTKVAQYHDEFEKLPSGNSWIATPWGDETTDTGYAFQGIDLFVKYINWRENGGDIYREEEG